MTELPLEQNRIRHKEKPLIPDALKNWVITLGLIALLLAITIPLRPYVDGTNLVLLYSLFVLIISSLTPGYFHGFVSAILCTFLFDFFITPPWNAFEFTIKLPITLLIMLIVTVISSAIAAYMKDIIYKLEKRENQSQFMYHMTHELMEAKDRQSIIQIFNQYLAIHLECSVVFYIGDPSNEDAYITTYPNDLTVSDFAPIQDIRSARHAYEENRPTGYKTNYNGDRKIYYLPLNGSIISGVVGISCLLGPLEEEDESYLKFIISQTTLALERQLSQEEQRQFQMESERERIRNSLLRAISHDLRTPLTSILGASNTLLNQGLDLDQRDSKHLIQDIKEESEWLIRIVENLLTVTRLIDANSTVETSPEVAEEVIGQAVRIIRKWYPDWSIHVKAPAQPFFVPMDATLISQVLLNLMDNAVKHSTPEDLIFINLKKQDDVAVFQVSDNGSGISEDLLENLFDSSSSSPKRASDSSSGAGLGLSICSSIIKAHSGTISGANKESGGAIFTFKLPLERKTQNEAENTDN